MQIVQPNHIGIIRICPFNKLFCLRLTVQTFIVKQTCCQCIDPYSSICADTPRNCPVLLRHLFPAIGHSNLVALCHKYFCQIRDDPACAADSADTIDK